MIDLDEIEKLAKSATPGPWALQYYGPGYAEPPEGVAILGVADFGTGLAEAEYVSKAHPQAILELVERVRQTEARIAEAAKLHRKYTYYELEDSCPDTSDEHREEHHHEASDDIGEFYCDQMPTGDVCCDTCRDVNGDRMDWPCPTAVALGLNEGDER